MLDWQVHCPEEISADQEKNKGMPKMYGGNVEVKQVAVTGE